ncbi:RNA dependent RNA polymerase [Clostridium nigeriense]|uniref:RNA dependent RNA polymerase n=1 Tax=Clostridium nigeriense TaxID=1805470 RepID=UPI003D338401
MSKNKTKRVIIKGYNLTQATMNDEGKLILNNKSTSEELTLSESQFLHMFCKISGVEFVDGMNFNYIIKVSNVSLKRMGNLIAEGKEYTFLTITPNQSKKKEAFYINVDYYNFAKKIFNLADAGRLERNKISEKYKNGEISIAKDLTARWSLLFSGSNRIVVDNKVYIPNMICVSDIGYKVYTPNTKIFKDGQLVKAEGEDAYNKVIAFDGCGVMTDKVATMIGKGLGLKKAVPYAVIRTKMATKGLLTNVNIIKYLNDKFPYLKREDGYFYIKDCWGADRKVTEDTIIVNQSMVKWSKWFDSMEDYENNREEAFADLLDCLYVTKYGKGKSKTMAESSYQLLTMLNLTYQEVLELAEPTRNILERIIYGEELATKDFLNIESEVSTLEEYDDDSIMAKNVADKIHMLLGMDYKKFIAIPRVRKGLLKMIERKVKELASGKFYLNDTSFKVACADPLLFLNYCMEQTQREITDLSQVEGGLKKGEFYIKGEVGTRMLARFPLASYQEITNDVLVQTPEYDKYCNFSNEILVFNQRWIDAMIKSGCDFDGDIILVSNNESLKNSVIPPADGLLFVNKDDASSKSEVIKIKFGELNDEIIQKENMRVLGNKIGKLAIASSAICSQCQSVWFDVEGNLFNSEILFSNMLGFQNYSSEFYTGQNILNFNNEISKYMNSTQVSIQDQKELMTKCFHDQDYRLNKLIQLSMKEIDSNKTGVQVTDKEIEEVIGSNQLKPRFFMALPDKKYSKKSTTMNMTSLSLYYNDIATTIYIHGEVHGKMSMLSYVMESIKNKVDDNTKVVPDLIATLIDTLDYDVQDNELIAKSEKDITEAFKKYIDAEKTMGKLRRIRYLKGYKLSRDNSIDIDQIFNATKIEQAQLAEEIFSNYKEEQIIKAMLEFFKNSKFNKEKNIELEEINQFLINYYWTIVEKALRYNYPIMVVTEEDENGTPILFTRKSLKERKIKEDCFGAIARMDKQLLQKKLDAEIGFNVIIEDKDKILKADYIGIRNSKDGFIILNYNGEILGKLYLQYLKKNIEGIYKVNMSKTRVQGKSGYFVLS